MKFSKELIAGSLALGMMVTSVRAEDPAPVPTVCIGLVAVDEKEAPGTDVQICVLPPAPIVIDGEEEVIKIDDGGEVPIEWVIRGGTDDPLIYASSGGPINTLSGASTEAPAISTDAGKDEASAVKAAGISAPAKSIASVGKRTSAVVKSGRVFLTH
ncbi:MAG: hypothetical protein NTV80_01705 [Verrucomicrobia bacterium]|nr:hypothetical protein [Verrucomicrobiota bacterium]